MRRWLAPIAAAAVLATVVPAAADEPLTKDQAETLGHALVLQDADMPDYAGYPHVEPKQLKRIEQKINACMGLDAAAQPLADVNSFDYSRVLPSGRIAVVASEALVMPSEQAAVDRLGLSDTARAHACSRKFHNGVVVFDKRVKVLSVKHQTLTSAIPGVRGEREVVTLKFQRKRSTSFTDAFTFQHGLVDVTLLTVGTGAPVDSSEEQALLQLLVERANSLT